MLRRRSGNVATWGTAAIFAAATLAPSLPAAAQSWRASGDRAGFSVGGTYNGLTFVCLGGGRARLLVNGFDDRLQAGQTYTISLTVEDMGHLFRATAIDGGAALGYDAPVAEFSTLIEALRRARTAEVAIPAGHFDLPLKGSSAALQRFAQECPS